MIRDTFGPNEMKRWDEVEDALSEAKGLRNEGEGDSK